MRSKHLFAAPSSLEIQKVLVESVRRRTPQNSVIPFKRVRRFPRAAPIRLRRTAWYVPRRGVRSGHLPCSLRPEFATPSSVSGLISSATSADCSCWSRRPGRLWRFRTGRLCTQSRHWETKASGLAPIDALTPDRHRIEARNGVPATVGVVAKARGMSKVGNDARPGRRGLTLRGQDPA
jgi:hypothetical protein